MKGIRFTSTNGNHYYYDDTSGLIYPAHSETVMAVRRQERVSNSPIVTCVDIKKYLAIHGYKQLLLETTESCNLRCKYCCYSDHYYSTRNHGSRQMDFWTAQKAIDYYMEHFKSAFHRNPLRHPVISFYGGEPLLNFSLIKAIIQYVKEEYSGFHPDYNITTNGMLFSDKIAEVLVENNFSIIFSLDGNKENHDRNRRKINGTGSFDTVFGNLSAFRKKYPNYQKIGLSVCFDYDTDLQKMSDFVQENNLFIVIANMVSGQETNYYNKFTEESITRFHNRIDMLKKRYFNLAKEKGLLLTSENLLLALFGFGYIEFSSHSILTEERPKFMPYTGSCIPGEKIYVTVDGMFHTCERINPNFPIGDVENGLDIQRITDYVRQLNECTDGCNECSISRLCDVCMAKATDKDKIVINPKICQEKYEYIKELLVSYVDLLEENPEQLENVVTAYYENLRKKVGNIFD